MSRARRPEHPRPLRAPVAVALGLALTACATGEWVGGVHAKLAYHPERGLRVLEVPDGPAAEAGLRPGDRIVSIDGTPIAGETAKEVQERLRGPVGTDVRLGVTRTAARASSARVGDPVEIVVRRAPYEPDS